MFQFLVLALVIAFCSGTYVSSYKYHQYQVEGESPKRFHEHEEEEAVHEYGIYLYTNAAPHGYNITEHVNNTDFNPNRPTKIILGVFIENEEYVPVDEFTTAYLRHGKEHMNVIVLEARFLKVPAESVWNHLAYSVSKLMRNLEVYGADSRDFHLIGLGYNADLAAMVARHLSPFAGRITGLDPENKMAELHENSARFVDIISTTQGEKKHGKVQFMPHGGLTQPHHEFSHAVEQDSHLKAAYYFIESIVYNGTFVAYRAHTWEDFKEGRYDQRSATVMGEYVPSHAHGIMYLDVNPLPLYGQSRAVKFYDMYEKKKAHYHSKGYKFNHQ